MARVMFLSHVKKDLSSGVWKKVLAQCAAIEKMGHELDFVYEDNEFLVIKNSSGEQKFKLPHRYLFFYILSLHINKSYDLVYLRKPHGGFYPLFASMAVSKIKKLNTAVRIVMEIPTYPYDKEQVGFKGKLSNLAYNFSLRFYKKKLAEIIFIGEGPDIIYGIKSRKIGNGVDLDSVVCSLKTKKDISPFVFAGIANLMFWHGYDRVISSIKNYKGEIPVKLYIVGDSEPEYSRLKAMVDNLGVSDKVIFTGRLVDQQIQLLLKDVNVCIDALGRHRSGNNNNSSIKSKEYTAMGIPFIKSHIDDSFLPDDFFIFQVAADESDIPIDKIVQWYKKLPDDFPVLERQVAMERFSWAEILQPIVNKDL